MEIEPYPEKEKTNFLESLIGLQEYMQEGVPFVTEFLLYYLLVWDGYEFRNQILRLIQWIVVQSHNGLYCFSFSRIISPDFHSKVLPCRLGGLPLPTSSTDLPLILATL